MSRLLEQIGIDLYSDCNILLKFYDKYGFTAYASFNTKKNVIKKRRKDSNVHHEWADDAYYYDSKFELESINSTTLIESFLYNYDCYHEYSYDKYSIDNTIEVYCVDKLLRLHKIYDISNWNVEVDEYGWYGPEIDYFYCDKDYIYKIAEDIFALYQVNDLEKIKFLLELEYSVLTPNVQTATNIEIITVPIEHISIGNKSHYDNLNEDYVDQYNDYKLARAVCLKTHWNGTHFNYKLLDGYHKVKSAINMKMKEIPIILLS